MLCVSNKEMGLDDAIADETKLHIVIVINPVVASALKHTSPIRCFVNLQVLRQRLG